MKVSGIGNLLDTAISIEAQKAEMMLRPQAKNDKLVAKHWSVWWQNKLANAARFEQQFEQYMAREQYLARERLSNVEPPTPPAKWAGTAPCDDDDYEAVILQATEVMDQ